MLIVGRTWKLRERDAKTKAYADKSMNAKPSGVQVGRSGSGKIREKR